MSHRLLFEPHADGTRLTREGWLEPTLIGRLMTPVVGRMLRRRFPTVARELRDYMSAQENAQS